MSRFRLFCAIFGLLLAAGACSRVRSHPDCSASSGFSLEASAANDSAVVENLDVLGRVWGYVQYHHPVFSGEEGASITNCSDCCPGSYARVPVRVNVILTEWIKASGAFEMDREKYLEILDSPRTHELAGLGWIHDRARLGDELSMLLRKLRYAARKGNRYAVFDPDSGILDMSHESARGAFDDCGYRLLYLFRYWNAIEYFCPNRCGTDRDWGTIPARFIPLFAAGIRDCRLLLHREWCDSHAAGDAVVKFGERTLPVAVDYAEGRMFVARDGILNSGDEIRSVDGKH